MTKLTQDVLLAIGFRGEGRDITNSPAFRLEVPKNRKYGNYPFQIQIVLEDYPEKNPNSGVFSLYSPAVKDSHMIVSGDQEHDFILEQGPTKEETAAIKYVDIPEKCQPIAWHVTTLERFNAVYTALTDNPPLQLPANFKTDL